MGPVSSCYINQFGISEGIVIIKVPGQIGGVPHGGTYTEEVVD